MKKSDDGKLIFWIFVVGGPIFLLMTHPIIFWLVFVPLAVFGIVSFIAWLKK